MSDLGWMPNVERVMGVYQYTPGGQPKVGFCDHAMGGFYNTCKNKDFWNLSVKCSVHFIVGRDGRKGQIINIFDRAWGQGRLGPQVSWPPYNEMNFGNPNEYLISIEHEDWELVNGVARAVPNSEWTQAEYDADLAIKEWCIAEHQYVKNTSTIPFGFDSLASHYMFDSVNRANCAGKYWRDVYDVKLWHDLNIVEEEDDSMAMWAMWDEWTPDRGVPFRSYVLQASGNGLKSYVVPNAEQHHALENTKIAGELLRVSLDTLRAFGATPDPTSG